MSSGFFTLAEEMGGDETMAMFVALVVAAFGAARWLWPVVMVPRFGGVAMQRVVLGLTPALCLLVMAPALLTVAAVEVREDQRYVLLFLLVGGAWLTAMNFVLPLLGLSLRDDAVERRNRPATVVIAAAMFAVTIVYLGGNTGEGPTIWTTIGPAGLATVTLIGLWGIVDSLTHVSEQITIDRDMAAAVRHAGLLLAMALVLGRSVAGDWESADGTLDDFLAIGWPAAVLAGLALPLHILGRPTPQEPHPSVIGWGVAPASLFVGIAAAWLSHVGPW